MTEFEQIDLHDPEDLQKLANNLGAQCTSMLIELLRVIPVELRIKFCLQFLAAPMGCMAAATSPGEMKAGLMAAMQCLDTVAAKKTATHH